MTTVRASHDLPLTFRDATAPLSEPQNLYASDSLRHPNRNKTTMLSKLVVLAAVGLARALPTTLDKEEMAVAPACASPLEAGTCVTGPFRVLEDYCCPGFYPQVGLYGCDCVAAWPQPLPKAIIKSFINNSITVFGELQAGSRNTLNTQSGLADGPSSLPTFTHVQNLTDFLLDEASPNSYACDLIEAACGTICGATGVDTVPGCIGLGARAIVACEIAGWGPWDPGADACAITMSGAVTGFCVAAVNGAAKVFGTVGCIAAFGCA